MKRLLFTLIFLALAIGANAQEPSPTPKGKPAARRPATPQSTERPTAGARTASRSQSITGRVIDESNSPIEDAAIVSFPAGVMNDSSQSAATLAKIRQITTDEQGKFELENLTSGAYLIAAEVPGYVTAPDIDDNNREQKYYRAGDSLTIKMIKGGVITGTVTTSAGEPVTGVRVNPIRLRDLKDRPARQSIFDLQREWKTDDRGVYRIYGLEPGAYLISTGGKGFIQLIAEGYDGDVPTYYASATRDTATEIIVHGGEELMGIDIRYRDGKGHAISGSVSGGTDSSFVSIVTVILSDAVTEAFAGMLIIPMAPGAHAFAFDVVPDGEYVIVAEGSDYTSGSAPRKITVKGADVTGLELAITQFGSIEGRVALEQALGATPKVDCQNKGAARIEEIVIFARPDLKSKQQATTKAFNFFPFPLDSAPNDKGDFKAPRLEAARYHIEARMPSEDLYIRRITLPPDAPSTQLKDGAQNGVTVKTSERVTGMNITIAERAAGVRGRVLPATEGARLSAALRLHLIPAEKESAEETLRFAEVAVESDGTFALTNLAPGKYWVLARALADEASTNNSPRPMAWDNNGRKQLRKEGEAANIALELQPCQRLADYVLRYKKQ
jgi:protocatechuate 3,4-dioxygenase beta subunit